MTGENKPERRVFKRLCRGFQIRIKEYTFPERGNYRQAKIVDISGGGLLVETRGFIAPQTTLKIEMNFTGWQRYTPSFLKHFGSAATKPLIVLAEVMRTSPIVAGRTYHTAVVFTGIDESHRTALIRFIRAEILSDR